MRFSKLILGITLSTATLGAAVGGAFALNNSGEKAQSAEAATTTRRFFLDCTQHGDYDKEQSIGIQYYNGSYIKKEATKVTNDYWYVDVPSSNLSKVQFFRCDTGNVNKNYNWQWEGNPSSVNYYSVKGWDNNGDWSNANGADEIYEVASTTPSTSTKRVWVDPKDNFYDGGARAGLRVFNGDTYIKTYVLGGSSQYCSVGDQAYIFYVDILTTYDCQLVRLHNVFNIVWTYGKNISTMDGYNTTKIVYQWTANIGGDNPDYSVGNPDNPTVDYAKKVLDGYSTCLNSSVNGYGAYSEINSNVVSKLSAADKNTLRSATFTAPTYGTRTYGDKLDLMASKSGASSNVVNALVSNNNNLLFVILGIASTLVLVSACYFFFKKKETIK